MNINFSRFKKIETDDNCTTLQHESGHTLKIAHKGLSEENRKELDKLPQHLAKGGFAKHARANDPTYNKGSKASKPAASSTTMPGSPTEAKNMYTEPQDSGGASPDSVERESMITGFSTRPSAPSSAISPPLGKNGTPLPCLNTACKSHGRPHPRCMCYNGKSAEFAFAEGGEVSDEYFCDSHRRHFKECEYAEGGEVGVNKSSMQIDRPANKIEKSWAGESEAGYHLRNSDINRSAKQSAKDEHHKTLGQMKAQPKPKIQGFAEGTTDGPVQPQDPTQDMPQLQQPALLNTPQEDPSPQAAPDTSQEPDNSVGAPNPPTNIPLTESPQQNPNQPAQAMDPYANYKQKQFDVEQFMHDESNKFYSDVNQGHVQAKTMQQLFHDKSLPGKIGTIFGLIISGAGAGLSHQDNAMLGTMKSEIANDLASQEKNQENRKNLMSMNGQNLMNMVNAGKIGADTRQMKIAQASDQVNYYLYNQMAKQAADTTNPQQAAKAALVLSAMKDYMITDKASAFAKAAGANALGQVLRNPGGSNGTLMKSGLLGPEAAKAREDYEQKDVPGYGVSQIPVTTDTKTTLGNLDRFDKSLDNLKTMINQNKGSVDWKKYPGADTAAQEASQAYTALRGSNPSLAGDKNLNKLITGGSNPLNILSYFKGNPGRIDEIKKANALQRNSVVKMSGLPQQAPKQKNQQSQQPPIERLYNGRVVLFDSKTKKFLGYK